MERARLFARALSITALLLLIACSAGQKVQPTAPTVSLAATPTSVGSGATSTLTWSSTNATACTGSGGWSGAVAPSGTQVTAALTASTSYSLTCTGSGGSSPPASVTVAVVPVPTASLTANPQTVAMGGTSTLTWTSTNATSCTASGAWSGAQPASGTLGTGALSASATYSLV